jgi:hypothetical protein
MNETLQKYVAYFFFLAGFCLLLIQPSVTLSKREKLTKEVFVLKSFLPSFLGLLCLLVAYWASLSLLQGVSDLHWNILIAFTAAGGIACSIIAAFHSTVLIRWRAD